MRWQRSAYSEESHTYSRFFHFNNQGMVKRKEGRILYHGKRADMELIFPQEDAFI